MATGKEEIPLARPVAEVDAPSATEADTVSGLPTDPLAHYVNAISFIAAAERAHAEALRGADAAAYAAEEAAYQTRIGEMKTESGRLLAGYSAALESTGLSSDDAAAKAERIKSTVADFVRKHPSANPEVIYAAVAAGLDPTTDLSRFDSSLESDVKEQRLKDQMHAAFAEAERTGKPVYSIFGFVPDGVTSKPIRDADAVTGGLAFTRRMHEMGLLKPDENGMYSNGRLTLEEQGQVLGVLTLVVQQNNSAASAINIGIHTLSAGGKEVIEALAAGGNAFLANMDNESKQQFDYKVTQSEITRIGDDLWAILRDPKNTSYAAGNPELTPEQLALLPAKVREKLGTPPTLQKLAMWLDPQFTNPDIAASYTGNLPKKDGGYDGVYIQGLGEYGWYTGTIGGYVAPHMLAKLPGVAADPAERDADFKEAERIVAIESIKATAAAWDTNKDGSISAEEAEAQKNTSAFTSIANKMQNLGVLTAPAAGESLAPALIAQGFQHPELAR